METLKRFDFWWCLIVGIVGIHLIIYPYRLNNLQCVGIGVFWSVIVLLFMTNKKEE